MYKLNIEIPNPDFTQPHPILTMTVDIEPDVPVVTDIINTGNFFVPALTITLETDKVVP